MQQFIFIPKEGIILYCILLGTLISNIKPWEIEIQ